MSRSITLPASLGEQVLRYQTVRWLLGLLSLVLAPWFVFLPLWLLCCVFFALVWRLAVNEWYFKRPHLPQSLFLASTVFVLYIFMYGYDAWLELSVVALLLVFSAYIASMRTHHDSLLVAVLAFIVIGSAVLFSEHKLVNVYILLGSTAMTFVLLLLTRYQLQVEPKKLLEQSLYLFLSALPFAMLLFLVFPSISNPLFVGEEPHKGEAVMGVSSTMAPGMITEMVHSDEVVFRVQFEGKHPSMRDLYWRGPVFWDYDGMQWDVAYTMPSMQLTEIPTTRSVSQRYDYTVYFDPQTHPWVFPLDVPQHSTAGTYLTTDQQLLLEMDYTGVHRFDLYSMPRSLEKVGAVLSEEERERALALPVQSRSNDNPETRELVESWQKNADNDEELVKAALAFFKKPEFRYSLVPETWPSRNAIDAFLFKQKEGFCEHFSISFTYLMRLAGIPTRIVSGYHGGDYNALADYYVIRQSDAHSWVEVWLSGKGWQRYDIVEYIVSERIQGGMSAAVIGGDVLYDKNQFSLDFYYLSLTGDTLVYYWKRLLSYMNNNDYLYLNKFINGYFFVALSFFLIMWFFYILIIRFPKVKKNNELNDIYTLFCERLARIDFPREEHETPMTYARRVIQKRPDLEKNLLTIILLYNTCRYSHSPNVQLLEQLKESVKAFKPTEKT